MKNKRPVSVFRHLYDQPYRNLNSVSLYNSAKDSLGFVQRLGLLQKLPVHYGCVNCICWSDNGQLLLSGSDDQRLVISHAYNFKKLTDYKTSHRANIFSAKFLPNSGDRNIVSCSGDGIILFTDLTRPSSTHNNQFTCHTGTSYDVATVAGEPHTFLSCGEDSTVRCFDLRVKESCNKQDCTEDILISCQRAVTALTVNSAAPHQLAIGSSDSTVRLFDRRNMGTKSSGFNRANCVRPVMSVMAPGLEGKSYRITSLAYSPEGQDLLVSYSSEHLYLFDCKNQSCTTLEPSIGDEGDEDDADLLGGGVWSRAQKGGQGAVTVGLPPIRRLRLRGDWSDTGPDARPEREPGRGGDVGQARPTLHATLMQRMTDVLSRMLNDPATRAALSHGVEEDAPTSGVIGSGAETGGGELMMESGGEGGMAARQIMISPARSQLSEGDGSEGSNDMLWSSDELNTSGEVAVAAPSQQPPLAQPPPLTATASEETVSLPSFESTYSSYTNPVKPTELATDAGSVPGSSSAAADDTTAPASSSPSSSSAPAAAAAVATPPPPPSTVSVSQQTDLAGASANGSGSGTGSGSGSGSGTGSGSGSGSGTGSGSGSGSGTDQESLSCLTDQLFTMRHGFIEKHGTEPMVNLHYSEKGSTASRITMTVGDEINREAVASTSASASTSTAAEIAPSAASSHQCQEAVASSSSAEPEPSRPAEEQVAGPSQVATAPKKPPEPMSEEEDDSEEERPRPPFRRNFTRRLVHPIERDMENAIEAARNKSAARTTTTAINPLCDHKTKVPRPAPLKMKFTGHRNARTMIKEATFWGSDHVMSGSDCGHVFVWQRGGGGTGGSSGGRLVMLLEADQHVVNCVQPHPHLPLLATSGIDYDVKLWAPVHEDVVFNQEMADELMKRNEVMLEETKDTITVPASFMIRMLACLNQIRRGSRSRSRIFESNSSE